MPRNIATNRPQIYSVPYTLSSDGSNGNYVSVGTNVYNYERTQAFSLVFWIFPKSFPSSGGHIFSEYDSTNPYKGRLVRIDGGLLRFWLIANFGTNELKANYTPPPRGQWTRVVITYDGSSTLAGVKCYYNSILQTQAPASLQTLSATIVSTSASTRWGQWGGASLAMPMNLAKFGIANYVLTQTHIDEDYRTGQVRTGNQPIDYYETTEGSGTSLASIGTGAHNGTINGTITWDSTNIPKSQRRNLTQGRNPIS